LFAFLSPRSEPPEKPGVATNLITFGIDLAGLHCFAREFYRDLTAGTTRGNGGTIPLVAFESRDVDLHVEMCVGSAIGRGSGFYFVEFVSISFARGDGNLAVIQGFFILHANQEIVGQDFRFFEYASIVNEEYVGAFVRDDYSVSSWNESAGCETGGSDAQHALLAVTMNATFTDDVSDSSGDVTQSDFLLQKFVDDFADSAWAFAYFTTSFEESHERNGSKHRGVIFLEVPKSGFCRSQHWCLFVSTFLRFSFPDLQISFGFGDFLCAQFISWRTIR
jgi:hypothetical protein